MSIISQSKELTAFYNAYNDWLEAGAPEENSNGFSRRQGLCMAIYCFYINNAEIEERVSYEQTMLFVKAKIDRCYPFGRDKYHNGIDTKTNHLDPNRIRWVKAHLSEDVIMEFTLQ